MQEALLLQIPEELQEVAVLNEEEPFVVAEEEVVPEVVEVIKPFEEQA